MKEERPSWPWARALVLTWRMHVPLFALLNMVPDPWLRNPPLEAIWSAKKPYANGQWINQVINSAASPAFLMTKMQQSAVPDPEHTARLAPS